MNRTCLLADCWIEITKLYSSNFTSRCFEVHHIMRNAEQQKFLKYCTQLAALATVYSQAHGPLIFQVGLGSWVWTWMYEPHGYTWTALSTIPHTTDHGASCRHTCKYSKEWLYTHTNLFQFADGCLCVLTLRSLRLLVQGISIMLLYCIVHTPMYTCINMHWLLMAYPILQRYIGSEGRTAHLYVITL